jgi:hypothetical protein
MSIAHKPTNAGAAVTGRKIGVLCSMTGRGRRQQCIRRAEAPTFLQTRPTGREGLAAVVGLYARRLHPIGRRWWQRASEQGFRAPNLRLRADEGVFHRDWAIIYFLVFFTVDGAVNAVQGLRHSRR